MNKEVIENILITFASEPLCQATRRSRITLLIASLIGFLVFRFRIDPENFSLFGIGFNNFNQDLFDNALSFIIIFLLIDFLVHAVSDLLVRFNQVSEQTKHETLSELSIKHDNQLSKAESDANNTQVLLKYYWLESSKKYLWVLATIRVVLDTIIPVGFSVYVLLT